MQFIIDSEWSFAAFLAVSLLLMIVATYIIFMSKHPRQGKRESVSDPGIFRWKILPTRMLATIIAFGMMFIGMSLVGAWYYIERPIVDDYTFNIMAVSLIASLIAAVAAYGIALIGLYAKSVRGGRV